MSSGIPNFERPVDGVRAVDRALDILLAFTALNHEMTAGELLRRVDLRRPTLYRLLRTLENKGFVVSSGDPQRFSLGPSVGHLSYVWTSTLDIARVAQPMIHNLWSETGETVALYLRQGDVRVCAAELPSAQPLSFKRGVGHSVHVSIGASGRAILAFAEDAEYHSKKDRTPEEQAHYRAQLELVKKDGYAVSRDELIEGAVAIAAPFFAANNIVVGSLTVFGPSARVKQAQVENIASLLKKESEALSKALGAMSLPSR